MTAGPATPQSSAGTSANADDDERDRFRVFVPNAVGGDSAETELVLGLGDNNFVGVQARVANGQIFLGAGGGAIGQESLGAFRKTASGITVAINGLVAVSTAAKGALSFDQTATADAVLAALDLGWQSYKLADTIGTRGLSAATGDVTLYGDASVSIAAPVSVSTSAIGFNSLNAGFKAGVNSALFATVFGGFKAEMASLRTANIVAYTAASVIGGVQANLSARQGLALVEGKTVEIGSPTGSEAGVARTRGLLDGPQAATSRVQVRADDEITIEPGTRAVSGAGASTKIRATPARIRVETAAQRLTLDEQAGATTLVSGQSALVVSDSGISLLRAPAPIKKLIDTAVDGAIVAAEIARKTALLAAETLEANGASVIAEAAGAFVGASIGGIAGAAAGSGVGALGGLGGGALAGGAAAFAVEKGLAARLLGKAKQAMKEQAEKAYRAAVDAAYATETLTILGATSGPTPKIEVTDTSIELSVGLSKVTITAAGIEIKTMPGAAVTVNGSTIASGLGGAVQVL